MSCHMLRLGQGSCFTLGLVMQVMTLAAIGSEWKEHEPTPRLMPGEVPIEARGGEVVYRVPIDAEEGDWMPLPDISGQSRSSISGLLPEGLHENSSWADVSVDYRRQTMDGIPVLQIDAREVRSGHVQLAHTFSEDQYVPGRRYELMIRLRSPTNSTLGCMVRQRGKPYQIYHSFNLVPGTGFKEVRKSWVAGAEAGKEGLYLTLSEPGLIEIESMEIRYWDRLALVNLAQERFPEGWPGNLFRHTQFPLGLPTGWSWGRENSIGDHIEVGPAPEVQGTSGVAPLRIRTLSNERALRLTSEPVLLPLSDESVTIAIRCRGEGEFSLTVEDARGVVVKKTFQPRSDQLNREAWTFAVRESGPHVMVLEGKGEIILDTVQWYRGEGVLPFERMGETELHLSASRETRILWDDEEMDISYRVLGGAGGGRLRSKVINAYGQEFGLPDIDLSGEGAESGTLNCSHFAGKPRGVFRVEAWVEDGEGGLISPYEELVVHRIRRPRYWGKDAPDSPFGVHVESAGRHLKMAKASGINWVRFHDAGLPYVGWFWLEPEPGQWRFFDKEVQRYREYHLSIFAELGTAPTWASYWTGSGRTSVGYFDRFFQPRDLADYANYVRTVVDRYGDQLSAYDVWNEPWIAEWWGVDWDETIGGREGWITSEEPQKDYVEMKRVAYENVKQLQPEAVIAGFNTTSGGGGRNRILGTDWTRGVAEHGGIEFCDVISFHMYEGGKAGFPGCAVDRAIEKALGPVRLADGNWPKPVWMTEGSPKPAGGGGTFYRHTFSRAPTPNIFPGADALVRYQVACLTNGVSRIFLYSMHAHRHLAAPLRFSVLVTPEGYLNPSAAAQSTLAWQLEDTSFNRRLELAPSAVVYLFEADPGWVAVLVPGTDLSSETVLGDFSEELVIEDLLGNPLSPRTELGPYCIFIRSSGALKSAEDHLAKLLVRDGQGE